MTRKLAVVGAMFRAFRMPSSAPTHRAVATTKATRMPPRLAARGFILLEIGPSPTESRIFTLATVGTLALEGVGAYV